MTKPNTDLLSELFHSEEWIVLKAEIEQCLNNSLGRLKREAEPNRNEYAGEVRMAERILALEYKYKNAEIKKHE